MSQREFDAIIDDCFLDGAAQCLKRKYKDKNDLRLIKVFSRLIERNKGSLRQAV